MLCEGLLPRISTFQRNATLTNMDLLTENLEFYLDRTLYEADPERPPKECCDKIQIESLSSPQLRCPENYFFQK